MRKTLFLAALVMLATPAAARAQYWVEFNPGTCQVGPPPACVSGHWHPLQLPQTPARAAATPTLKASGDAADESSPEGQKQKKSTDISTDLEYESFSFGEQVTGTSVGLRGMYVKRNESGLGGGVILTGERSQMELTNSFTEPEASLIMAAHAFVSADLGERFLSEEAQLNQTLTGQVGISGSSFMPGGEADPINTYGPFATMQYSRFQGVFSYGASLTYSMAKLSMSEQFGGGISQSSSSWALGINGGYTLNESTYVSGDFYSIKGGLAVAGGTITRSFSPTFGLTLGAKTLLGQDDFSNYRLTLGTTYRVR